MEKRINEIINYIGFKDHYTARITKHFLKKIDIKDEDIEEFKIELKRQYDVSLVKPGTRLGNIISEILSSVVLQLGLDTFKISNWITMSYSFSDLSSILFATKQVKNPTATIYFNERYNMDEVFDKKIELVMVNLGDLITNTEIFSIKTKTNYVYRIFNYKNEKLNVLRLYMNKYKLYSNKITFKDIADKISENNKNASLFNVVYSSINEGYMDIVPLDNNIENNYILSKLFLETIIQIKIKGINGIRRLIPDSKKITNYCMTSVKKGKYWKVYIDNIKARYEGISYRDIYVFFKQYFKDVLLDHVLRPENDYKYNINILVISNEEPLSYIENNKKNNLLDELWYCEGEGYNNDVESFSLDDEDVSEKDKSDNKKNKEDKKKFNMEPDLVELLCNPYINSNTSYTNNIHNIKKVLGIEAARSYIIIILQKVFKSTGVNINPKFFQLIAEILTMSGDFLGVKSTSVNKTMQQLEPLEKLNVTNAIENLRTVAIKEDKNKFFNILSSTAAGVDNLENLIDDLKNKEINLDDLDKLIGEKYEYTQSIEPISIKPKPVEERRVFKKSMFKKKQVKDTVIVVDNNDPIDDKFGDLIRIDE